KPNLIMSPIVGYETDTLRPNDFSGLPDNHTYVQHLVGFVLKGSPLSKLTFNTKVIRDGTVLIDVPTGQFPITGDETAITQTMSLKPTVTCKLTTLTSSTACSTALSIMLHSTTTSFAPSGITSSRQHCHFASSRSTTGCWRILRGAH